MLDLLSRKIPKTVIDINRHKGCGPIVGDGLGFWLRIRRPNEVSDGMNTTTVPLREGDQSTETNGLCTVISEISRI